MYGIAFIGGEGPAPERAKTLAQEADYIVAADSGLLTAEQAGVEPDLIVGDMDSIGDLSRLDKYPQDRILRYPADKDHTDTELALSALWQQGCGETALVGGGGGRTDHLFAIRALFEREQCPDRWFTRTDDLYCLKAAGALALDLPPRSLVSVFPLGPGPWNVESRGLRWPLAGLPWHPGFFGLSNVAPSGACSLFVHSGRFLILVPIQQTSRPQEESHETGF
jgi:thiamine pyrophosphokinase